MGIESNSNEFVRHEGYYTENQENLPMIMACKQWAFYITWEKQILKEAVRDGGNNLYQDNQQGDPGGYRF